jgi:hypothetical protein
MPVAAVALVADEWGNHASVVQFGRAIAVVPLDVAAPPVLPAAELDGTDPAPGPPWAPPEHPWRSTIPREAAEVVARISAAVRRFDHHTERGLDGILKMVRPAEVWFLLLAGLHGLPEHDGHPIVGRVLAHYPRDARVHIEMAAYLLGRGEVVEAERELAVVDPATAPEGFDLVRGAWIGAIIAYRRGDLDAARAHLAAGRAHVAPEDEAHDQRAGAAAMLRFLDETYGDGTPSTVCAIRWHATVAAREAMRAGRSREALELLDARDVWWEPEPQSFSTLVEAWLAVEPTGDGETFRKIRALSTFVELWTESAGSFRDRELYVPGAHRPVDEIADLAARASRWLDRDEARIGP